MGVLPAAALILLISELQGDAQGGATITQRFGELPTGGPGGDSTLSYDTELHPELLVRLADNRFTASLLYDPRFLLRVQFPDGGDATVLEAGDRPFLILHSVQGNTQYRIAPRWTWTNAVQGLFGEQDFALFAQQGVGAGDGGGGGVTQGQVIETTSVNVVSTLVGPLVGHNDFRTTASFNITFPEGDLFFDGMAPPPTGDSDDSLCFQDPDEPETGANANLFIADTCQFGLATATISPLSEIDVLEIQGGYQAIDFDPGPFIHAVSADVLWRRRLSRRVEGRVRGGAILAIDANPFDGQDSVTPLPIVDVGLAWRFVNLRLLQVALDLELGADGFVEAVSRRYLLRAEAVAGISAVIRRDLTTSVRFSAFTLGPEQDCAPRQPLMDVRPFGCPDDLTEAERIAEIPDLTAFSTELGLTWNLDRRVSFLAAARYGFRAPHLSRIGEDTDIGGISTPFGRSQREISAQVGLRVIYGTRNDLGDSTLGAGSDLGTELGPAPVGPAEGPPTPQ